MTWTMSSRMTIWKWITEALTPPKKTKEDEDIEAKKRDSAVKMREAEKARGQALELHLLF